jgi:hypothetical protein
MDLKRTIQSLGAALALCMGLQAQEPWQGGFKLTAASFPGAEDAYLGQSRAYGVAMFGAYPLGRSASLAFEAGYRYLPTTTHSFPGQRYEDKSDGYYAGAFYQHRLFFEGFHLQAGLRVSQFVTARRANFLPGDGTSLLTKYRGEYATGIKPVVGAGYQLSDRYSFEVNAGQVEMKNVDGAAKTGTLLEIAFLVHL